MRTLVTILLNSIILIAISACTNSHKDNSTMAIGEVNQQKLMTEHQGFQQNYQLFQLSDQDIAVIKNWPSDLHHNSEYVSLFPNVMLGIHVDHYYAFWLEPLANNKTREHFEMYYVGDESASGDELKVMREKNFKFWQEVMNEDINAIEGMQEGRNSPAYNGGNFSPVMDTPTLMFHKWVANNLSK